MDLSQLTTDPMVATITFGAMIISIYAAWYSNKSAAKSEQQSNRNLIAQITQRLYDFDHLIIAHPELQRFLYEQHERTTAYFSEDTYHDEFYFQLKSLIYAHFNFFDEILCLTSDDKILSDASEIGDWKEFIKRKMKHPLFRELFLKEKEIFGRKFRDFCEETLKLDEITEPSDDHEMF
jgi:hypothetical protein